MNAGRTLKDKRYPSIPEYVGEDQRVYLLSQRNGVDRFVKENFKYLHVKAKVGEIPRKHLAARDRSVFERRKDYALIRLQLATVFRASINSFSSLVLMTGSLTGMLTT